MRPFKALDDHCRASQYWQACFGVAVNGVRKHSRHVVVEAEEDSRME